MDFENFQQSKIFSNTYGENYSIDPNSVLHGAPSYIHNPEQETN